MNASVSQRQESDRHEQKKWFKALFSRPEIGPVGVMLLLFGMLGYFSIPTGEFSFNPFAGEGFNALGIRNNLRVISQLAIIALGAGLLIVAGEFDLSIGSMIGFAGACMDRRCSISCTANGHEFPSRTVLAAGGGWTPFAASLAPRSAAC